MKLQVLRLPEPELFFGGNQKCIDPQVGLLKFGPHGGSASDATRKISIRAGVIGTDRSIDAARVWFDRLKYRIAAEEHPNSEYKGIDFPGMSLNSPLRFEVLIDKNCILKINRKIVRNLRLEKNRKKRILSAIKTYCDRFDDLTEAHPLPDIVLLPIDDELFRLCKEPHRKTDKIIYHSRIFGDLDTSDFELFDFITTSKRKQLVEIL